MSRRFVQLQVDVAYECADAIQLNDLIASIYQAVYREIGNGMLTDGAPEVEVASYQVSLRVVDEHPPVDQAEYPLEEGIE